MGTEKVVAHYLDGTVARGFLEDFDSENWAVSLRPAEAPDAVEQISLLALKGVFFVRGFEGKPPDAGGRGSWGVAGDAGTRTEVLCRDGETMFGTVNEEVDPTEGSGFFFFPVDRDGNNLKVFLTYAGLKLVVLSRGGRARAIAGHLWGHDPDQPPALWGWATAESAPGHVQRDVVRSGFQG